MRPQPVIFAIAVLVACSSAAPTGTTPPPPPPSSPTPGAPASIVLVTGDGQSAAPGTALPVKLAAQVKDASGLAVPGASVHFAIDSGGGSLSASTLTTGTDGTVSGVTWTLGAASGTNVVTVTVGTLASMRFHAQALGPVARTLVANMPMGSAGGTFRYAKAGDPLNGLTVTVPAGAYAAGTTWTIVADSSVPVPLPSGFSQVGPTLVVGNTQGFADDSNMTLTMPMHLADSMAVAPFYFDPASGTLEGIPLVGRTDTSATLATRHFSVDLMAIPGQGAVGSLRASLRAGFGNVRMIWVTIPQSQLVGTYASSFMPGVDDWEFINYGDYLNPGGDCEGMSITAMYYHYLFRLGASPNSGLYHRYDQSLANQWDNVQGIRYAATVQSDYGDLFDSGVNQEEHLIDIASSTGNVARNLTSSWIVLTLKLTHRPVLVGLEGNKFSHAVVAYAVSSGTEYTTVSVADPNRPGARNVTLTFDYGLLNPVNFQANASRAPEVATTAYALGVSGEVSLSQLATRWTEFTQHTAGSDRYARHYRVDVENQFDRTWSPLTANFVSYSQNVNMQTICTDCASDPTDTVQYLVIWNDAGSDSVLPPVFHIPIGPAASFNAVEYAPRGVSDEMGFLDVMPFSIAYQPVTISGPDEWVDHAPLDFTVQNPPAVPGVHYRFEWDFGDDNGLVDIDDSPDATHTYESAGARTVVVSITDLHTGHVIARASTAATVGEPHWVWTFDASAQTGSTPPVLATSEDTTEFNAFNGFFTDLQANPSHWAFFVYQSSDCEGVVLEQFPDANVNTTSLVDNTERTVVAASGACLTSDDPDTGTATFGTIGSGTIIGNLTPLDLGNDIGVLGGSINAKMTGKILTGTFTWIISFSTGYASYSYTFTAHQVGGT